MSLPVLTSTESTPPPAARAASAVFAPGDDPPSTHERAGGRGAAWTEERGTSDEERPCLKCARRRAGRHSSGANFASLVEHRVVRVGGHDGELAALPPEHLGPEPFRLREERVRRLAGEHVPGALLDLRPQLARTPAC